MEKEDIGKWFFRFHDMTNTYEVIESLDKIKVDSSDVIKGVKKDLEPAKGWATGYHFILSKSNDIALMEVAGADKEGHLKKLYFNGIYGKKNFLPVIT